LPGRLLDQTIPVRPEDAFRAASRLRRTGGDHRDVQRLHDLIQWYRPVLVDQPIGWQRASRQTRLASLVFQPRFAFSLEPARSA
jgi:hypothetical protein